jgi:ketosteroid isomerase-like protein
MDSAFAQHFATEWIAAWNAHDLDRVLSHYANDFEMSSPYIVTFAGEPSGTLVGKPAVEERSRTMTSRLCPNPTVNTDAHRRRFAPWWSPVTVVR